jgi:phage terminase large subunit-like protein
MGLRGPNAKAIQKVSRVGPADYKKNLDGIRPWEVRGLTRAEKVIAFLESLPITSGNLAGTNFVVRDWQRHDIIEPLYMTDDAGLRFVREGFISMPRKQGKTALVAGLCLCHLCGPEAIQRGQCASGAADREQAGIIYAEMCAIIERVPWMDRRIIVRDFKKTLEDAETGTTYKALSSDSKTKHGMSLSFWIVDELAQLPDRKLYDVLSTATAAWPEPLGVVISTQSEDPRHIMSQLYDDAEQIQSGIISGHWRKCGISHGRRSECPRSSKHSGCYI